MNDFRKYATKHLGMDGMVLDDVMRRSSNTSTLTSWKRDNSTSRRWMFTQG